MKLLTTKAVVRVLVLAGFLALGVSSMLSMPSAERLPPPPAFRAARPALVERLRGDVRHLADTIGPRHTLRPEALARAADYIESEFASAGYATRREGYDVRGVRCENVVAERRGARRPDSVVVLGAHYDSIPGCPGANDNASGVAALLALARRLRDTPLDCTVRYVAFVNEEPPHFQQPTMGSLHYARGCRERKEHVLAMVSLETIGYFSEEPGSQHYPPGFAWFYPSRGNFIAFVGNWGNRSLVRRALLTFRRHAEIPSEGAAPPGAVRGVGWSDHWSFWQAGYRAFMVTDTAIFRYPHYHHGEDTPDKLDYERMAMVVEGLEPVVADLATGR